MASAPELPAGRRFLRRLLRLAGLLLLLIVGSIVAYGGAALLLARVPVNRSAEPSPDGIEVFLVSNGVHVDLVVSSREGSPSWKRFLRRVSPIPGDELPPYLSFGWGERRFFLETPTWDDLEASVAVSAALWPTPTAVHVTALEGRPVAGPQVRAARVARENYAVLLEHLRSGFRVDDRGTPVRIECCEYAGRRNAFFEGTGSYHAFRTCNSWTNRGLRRAGLRTALWAPFASSVLRHFPIGDPPDSSETGAAPSRR